MKNLPQRKSIRLKNYDYSTNGFYYITVCTQNRECLLGEVVSGNMEFNGAGEMIKNIWGSLPNYYPVELDAFQIMPNHVHFIIQMGRATMRATTRVARTTPVGAGFMPARDGDPMPARDGDPMPARDGDPMPARDGDPMPARDDRATTRVARTLGEIVGGFKSISTVEYIKNVKNCGWKPFDKRLWQRNYYEHIVRSEDDLDRIRCYIENNPKMWPDDKNNPKNCNINL